MKAVFTIWVGSALIFVIQCPRPSHSGPEMGSSIDGAEVNLSEKTIDEITKRVTKEIINAFNKVTPFLAKKKSVDFLLMELGYYAFTSNHSGTEAPGTTDIVPTTIDKTLQPNGQKKGVLKSKGMRNLERTAVV